jgi:hypothetical protein
MLNHPEMMWRYADTLTRQAEIEGRGCCYDAPLLSAIAQPRAARRSLRILGFRNR